MNRKRVVWAIAFAVSSWKLLFAQSHLHVVSRVPAVSRGTIQHYGDVVNDWAWQEHIQIALILAVILFGALITIFQGLNKGWCKPATLVLGACVTVLTSINTKFFEADYRVLKKSVSEGKEYIQALNTVADSRSDPHADQEALDKEWTDALNKLSGLAAALNPDTSKAAPATTLLLLESTVYAQSSVPPWIQTRPSDKFNFYYPATAEAQSLSAARQSSFDKAVALGAKELSGQDCDEMRKFIASSAVIEKTAFEFDKSKSAYRFYTLLRISNEAKNYDLKNICTEDSKPIAVPGKSKWLDTGIKVGKGDTVLFTATGQVQWGRGSGKTVGPDGSTTKLHAAMPPAYPVSGIGAGGLIAKIGSASPFAVGKEKSVVANGSGSLWLGINDNHWDDNSGEFSVVIRLRTKQ